MLTKPNYKPQIKLNALYSQRINNYNRDTNPLSLLKLTSKQQALLTEQSSHKRYNSDNSYTYTRTQSNTNISQGVNSTSYKSLKKFQIQLHKTIRHKRNISMNEVNKSIHLNLLKQQGQTNESYSLIALNLPPIDKEVLSNSNKSNNEKNINCSQALSDKTKTTKYSFPPLIEYIKSLRLSYLINDNFTPTVSNHLSFALSCKNMHKINLLLDVKKERIRAHKDNVETQLQQYNYIIYKTTNQIKYLTEVITPNITLYGKHIERVLNTENEKVNMGKFRRDQLKMEIGYILRNLEVQKQIYYKYIKFKNLLICVKEKRVELPEFLSVNRYLRKYTFDRNLIIHARSRDATIRGMKENSMNGQKLSTIMKDNEKDINGKKYINNSEPVYKSTDDFFKDMNKLEINGVTHTKLLGMIDQDILDLREELKNEDNFLNEFNKDYLLKKAQTGQFRNSGKMHYNYLAQQKKNYLKRSLDWHKNKNEQYTLNKWKKSNQGYLPMLHLFKYNSIKQQIRGDFEGLYVFARDVINNTLEGAPKQFNVYLIDNQQGMEMRSLKVEIETPSKIRAGILYLLRYIEIFLFELIAKSKKYKDNPLTMNIMKVVSVRVVGNRKLKNAIIQRKNMEIKKIKMIQEVIYKKQKYVYRMKRKVEGDFYKNLKLKKSKKDRENEERKQMRNEDYLYFMNEAD